MCQHFRSFLYWYLDMNLASISPLQRRIWDLRAMCTIFLREMVDLRIRLPTILQATNAIVDHHYLDTLADCQYSRDSTLAHRWATTTRKTYYSLARPEHPAEGLGLLDPSVATANGDVRHQECCESCALGSQGFAGPLCARFS